MAKIRGRPGKTAGSPAEGVKFEQEIYMTAAEMADMLRGLADEVEDRGRVEASFGDWTIGVNPADFQVRYSMHDPANRVWRQLKLKENP